MLVSGRAETTEKSLDSLRGLLEQVDSELILVDTGCGEKLRKKLHKYTDKIISFIWCDDFAKARNAGLSQAVGEWFLYLDDDEWFEDVTPIVDFLNSQEEKKYDQAVYQVRNYINLEGTSYSQDWSSRMMRITEETHFAGKVHEQLLPAVGKCKKIPAFVHHFGYAYPDKETKLAHFERNMSIMKKMMEEEPNNMRWKLQAIKEYYSVEQFENGRSIAEAGVALVQSQNKEFVNLCRGVFYTAILQADIAEKKFADLAEHAQMYLQDSRNPIIVNCSLCENAVLGLWNSKEKDEWLKIVEAFCRNYFTFLKQYEVEEKTEQQQIIEENAIFVHLAVEKGIKQSMSVIWAEVLSKLDRKEEFPEEYVKEIEEEVQKVITGNANFLFLSEEIWRLGEVGVVPLEDMLLGLPFDQWMAQVVVLESEAYGNPWIVAEKNLCRICTQENIRYDYFNMHEVNRKIQSIFQLDQNVEKLDEKALQKLLLEYVLANINYAVKVYTKEAFEGDMEILPDFIRAACYLDNAMKEESDWSAILEGLGKAARTWKPLGELAKKAAYFVGKAQKRAEDKQQQETEKAKEQMQQMAAQVLSQVEQMMDQGQYAEAMEIVGQLRRMLPEDEKIQAMEKRMEEENAGK